MPIPDTTLSTVYGPVHSWRFGHSLGIDPICIGSVCSFDCIYCQLGRIQEVTATRREFVPAGRVARDLAATDLSAVDVVTISGNGEPTLALNLADIIAHIRAATPAPLQILTNATLLGDPDVRAALASLDLVACKLDAADPDTLARVNRPAPGVTLPAVLDAIERFRAEYSGALHIQIMFLPATIPHALDWAPLLRRIRPDEVHLNTPRRPYPLAWYPESRGDHEGRQRKVPARQLAVITPDQARQAAHRLSKATGIPIVTVYDHPPAA